MILVDTSVWSLAYRRRGSESNEPSEARTLRGLTEADEEIVLPGIVLQELLSGIPEQAQFGRLEEILAGFPLLLATQETHIEAARIANLCRSKGIAVSTVDCLIAAMAIEHNAQLLTSDRDFVYMADHCPLRLFENKWQPFTGQPLDEPQRRKERQGSQRMNPVRMLLCVSLRLCGERLRSVMEPPSSKLGIR